MKSIIYSVTKEELQQYINESKTYGQILKRFGLENKGANAKTLKRRIEAEKLNDASIIKNLRFGGGWNKGTRGIFVKKMPLEEAMKTIFISNSECHASKPKNYIRSYNLMEEKCSSCGLKKEWNGKQITLELEHIDGNSHNNELSNLTWLCPNCHSQTPTFRGRNRKIRHYCLDCKKEVTKHSTRCVNCQSKHQVGRDRKVIWPTKEELEALIQTTPLTKIGKQFGVSGNAIKKWCKSYGLKNGGVGGI